MVLSWGRAKWDNRSSNMMNPRHKSRERVGVLAIVSLCVFLGCSGGKAGGTAPTPGQGGNTAAGGSTTAALSASSTPGGASGASVASAGGGSAGGGSLAGGTTFATGGSGAGGTVTGGISAASGGTPAVGNAGATAGGSGPGGTATSVIPTGGIPTGGISAVAGGSRARGGIGGSSNAGSSGGATATGGRGGSTAGTSGGGTTTGGQATGGSVAGNPGGTTATGGQAAGGSSSSGATASISKDSEILLTNAGLTIVSYGGYLNGESFQQEGIVSYEGYQYAAFWNTSRHVVLARRALPSGTWSTLEFTDYSLSADDAHNTISLGICPGDGTLHLSFDHHSNDLHYRKSIGGLVTSPSTVAWAASSFSAVSSSLAGSTTVALVTYPRFVTEPAGDKLLFEARIGTSGSGDEYLWEYDSATHAWTSLGLYISGIADSLNAYPHGLSYTRGGSRLHLSWCWRETPDASTNHDLLYIYSDDHGRTWKNNIGAAVAATGSSSVSKNSSGINVWPIAQNRGLINQEHMAVDASGRVHVLLSHMPDAQADDANFTSARSKSQFFHYWRNTSGTWTRTAMGLSVVANFRGKLAISSNSNVYAVLPDLRIAAASAAASFASWVVLNSADSGRFFSDPLIDTARLGAEDKLTVFYPQKSSPNIYVLDYTVK